MKILCENIKKSYNKPLSEKKSLFSNRYGKNKVKIINPKGWSSHSRRHHSSFQTPNFAQGYTRKYVIK